METTVGTKVEIDGREFEVVKVGKERKLSDGSAELWRHSRTVTRLAEQYVKEPRSARKSPAARRRAQLCGRMSQADEVGRPGTPGRSRAAGA